MEHTQDKMSEGRVLEYYWGECNFLNGWTAPVGLGVAGRGFEITFRYTTLGRTPLDDRSARHIDHLADDTQH